MSLLDLVARALESIAVGSPAFPEGAIPAKYACSGPMSHRRYLQRTFRLEQRSLLLLVYDPAVPRDTFVQWSFTMSPLRLSAVPESVPPDPAVEGLGL